MFICFNLRSCRSERVFTEMIIPGKLFGASEMLVSPVTTWGKAKMFSTFLCADRVRKGSVRLVSHHQVPSQTRGPAVLFLYPAVPSYPTGAHGPNCLRSPHAGSGWVSGCATWPAGAGLEHSCMRAPATGCRLLDRSLPSSH